MRSFRYLGTGRVFDRRLPLRGATMNETTMDPIHPGVILLEESLEPLGITQYRLAKSISVPRVVWG